MPAKWGVPVFVTGAVLLAVGGAALLLAFAGGDARVTSETYVYSVFVRLRNPGGSAELWVPVPDFPELRDRTSVDPNFGDFPNTNVTQTVEASAYGTMFRFVFSDSFAVRGAVVNVPGAADGTLTFSSQVSDDVWIRLANVTPGNEVSVILHYELVQTRGFLSRNQVFFAGTADPRTPQTGLILRCGYLLDMIRDDAQYTVLSPGWGPYPLTYGAFAWACD